MPLVQPPRYAISAEARGIDVAGGHREDKGRGGGREEEAWYARAVVWMRGLEFDPESETEIEGTR